MCSYLGTSQLCETDPWPKLSIRGLTETALFHPPILLIVRMKIVADISPRIGKHRSARVTLGFCVNLTRQWHTLWNFTYFQNAMCILQTFFDSMSPWLASCGWGVRWLSISENRHRNGEIRIGRACGKKWQRMSPHCEKVLGSNPNPGLSVWGLQVLPLHAWASKLPTSCEWSVCVCVPCSQLATWPAHIPASCPVHAGTWDSPPATLTRNKRIRKWMDECGGKKSIKVETWYWFRLIL